jgi:FtsP/CotA-like multicopper oxidase with cupredoxin domain
MGFIRNSPGPTFEVTRGVPITVSWKNEITTPHMFAVDPTLHWANPNGLVNDNTGGMPMFTCAMEPGGICLPYPTGYTDAQRNVPLVTHVHGAEVQSTSDGHPDSWFTANAIQGPAYNSLTPLTGGAVFQYPNAQQAATIWYHDHALGITRINVMSGLAGFYLIRDAADTTIAPLLPQGKYEVPLAIQDRSFNPDGSFYFPSVGLNPTIHPYWMPEFFGNTIMVNGLVWPNMNVDRGTYRFRLLDGSNARFYTLSFSNKIPFTQIGSDGGYLKAPVTLTELTIAPGERADILVDFSKLAPGTKVILTNTAKAPTPRGTAADPQTTGQIMQFTVTANPGQPFPVLPAPLNPTLTGVAFPTNTKILTLQEVMGPAGPVEILLDGQKWAAPISESPKLGTTEDWVIVNPTADTHPIHLHLVQFQLVSRQPFQVKKYQTAWTALNGMAPLMTPTVNVPSLAPYLQGKPVGPTLAEQGWKDTIQMRPGEVTTIRVRFTAQDGTKFPFDATSGPGYVWHCHIIDHEDNEMMRPYKVVP